MIYIREVKNTINPIIFLVDTYERKGWTTKETSLWMLSGGEFQKQTPYYFY